MKRIEKIAFSRRALRNDSDDSVLFVSCSMTKELRPSHKNYIQISCENDEFCLQTSLKATDFQVLKQSDARYFLLYLPSFCLHIMVMKQCWYELVRSSDLPKCSRLLLLPLRGWQSNQKFFNGQLAHIYRDDDGEPFLATLIPNFAYDDVLTIPARTINWRAAKCLASTPALDEEIHYPLRLRDACIVSLRESLTPYFVEDVFFKVSFSQYTLRSALCWVLLRMAFQDASFLAELPNEKSTNVKGVWKRLFQNLGVFCDKAAVHIDLYEEVLADKLFLHVPDEVIRPLCQEVNQRGFILPKDLFSAK